MSDSKGIESAKAKRRMAVREISLAWKAPPPRMKATIGSARMATAMAEGMVKKRMRWMAIWMWLE